MSQEEERIHEASNLDIVARNLTELAEKDKLPRFYKREDIKEKIISLFSFGQHPLMVGGGGTGKTALAGAVAKKILSFSDRDSDLSGWKVYKIEPPGFQYGAFYMHNFENIVFNIVKQCKKEKIILFIDHTVQATRAGATDSSDLRTLANLLLPFMEEEDFYILGAATPEDYELMCKTNPQFVEKFTKVEIPEMSASETREILKKAAIDFMLEHSLEIEDQAIEEIIDLSERFYQMICFPGKAFELFKRALSKKIEHGSGNIVNSALIAEDIYKAVKDLTDLPDFIIYEDKKISRKRINKYFFERVFGQKNAINNIVDTILLLKTGFTYQDNPVSTFLFVGPTGVGKTLLARTLAECLFGSPKKLLRYDMSEYNQSNSVSRFIGSEKDFTRKGLVQNVIANPFCVILLDEIEKAHHDIFNVLLQALGEARITDEKGTTVSLKNTVIIMTSNVGSELYGKVSIGLGHNGSYSYKTTQIALKNRIKNFFPPEFINRLTSIIYFNPLSQSIIRKIAKKEIKDILNLPGVKKAKINLNYNQKFIDNLAAEGYSPEYGARPMKRAIRKLLLVPLAERIASGEIRKKEIVKLPF